MDSFFEAADSIDKVLDEFEKSEDLTYNVSEKPVSTSTVHNYTNSYKKHLNNSHGVTLVDNSLAPSLLHSEPLLDMSEADFTPSSETSYSKNYVQKEVESIQLPDSSQNHSYDNTISLSGVTKSMPLDWQFNEETGEMDNNIHKSNDKKNASMQEQLRESDIQVINQQIDSKKTIITADFLTNRSDKAESGDHINRTLVGPEEKGQPVIGFDSNDVNDVSEQEVEAYLSVKPDQENSPKQASMGHYTNESSFPNGFKSSFGQSMPTQPEANELAGLDPFYNEKNDNIDTLDRNHMAKQNMETDKSGNIGQISHEFSNQLLFSDKAATTVDNSHLRMPSQNPHINSQPEFTTEEGGNSIHNSFLGTLNRIPKPEKEEINPLVNDKQTTIRQNLFLDFNNPTLRKPPTFDADEPPVSHQPQLSVNETTTVSYMQDFPKEDEPIEETTADSEDYPSWWSGALEVNKTQLGSVKPVWLLDSETSTCMKCRAKFTLTKRRHHCRACGKIFCSNCCNQKVKLKYMDYKEDRVCVTCCSIILRADAMQRVKLFGADQRNISPNPNNPEEYCSTVPPLEQVNTNLNKPPPTVMVPITKSVLRRPDLKGAPREPRSVRFSDGINPGSELSEINSIGKPNASTQPQPASPATTLQSQAQLVSIRTIPSIPSPQQDIIIAEGLVRSQNLPSGCLIPSDEKNLPPVLIQNHVTGDFTFLHKPNLEELLKDIKTESSSYPIIFVLTKNLYVFVKFIYLHCCVKQECWCFSTYGMPTAGQDEIVILLESLQEENTIPKDILTYFYSLYEQACKGKNVSDMDHTLFTQTFLGSRDHGGFLYIKPSYQCVRNLVLPHPPYLVAILLQKWEMPWAKVFPLRLMLRLGAEFRYYPCPLVSVRYRKPVYGEIGHTIMNLLADFKNYQYMLPKLKGALIHMQDKQTTISFPRNRYDDLIKLMSNCNEHVMALSANFSVDAESHLVCIQNDEGNYLTQAINIQNKPRKVTGASFVVFNGALKATTGLSAKSSIVEDGLMVQISPDSMAALRQALHNMEGFSIQCGCIESEPDEIVSIEWVEEDRKINTDVFSPVDGKPLAGIESIRIQNSIDYAGVNKTIRWTEVFFIHTEDVQGVSRYEPVDLSRLAETIAQACGIALLPHLDGLKENYMSKIGLRVTLSSDRVGYEIGSNGKILPSKYMTDLDENLIPVISSDLVQSGNTPIVLELLFHILE